MLRRVRGRRPLGKAHLLGLSPFAAPPKITSLPLTSNVRACRVPPCIATIAPRLMNATSCGASSDLLTRRSQRGGGAGLWGLHSPDGIHWQVYPDQPNPPNQSCDTQNMFFWDDTFKCYVGYTRVRETQSSEEAALAGKAAYRSIGRITSPDFRTWSSTQIVLEADEEDLAIPVPSKFDNQRPSIDYYTSCAMKYESAQDVYLMFPSVYYHWGEHGFPATMDTQLLSSRDGINWRHQGNRRPFLQHGMDNDVHSGMIFANPWLIPVDAELWLYYAGMAHSHAADPDDVGRSSSLFRARMRRDGFVSADAGFGGGQFITPVLSVQWQPSRIESQWKRRRLAPSRNSGHGWTTVARLRARRGRSSGGKHYRQNCKLARQKRLE